MRGGSAKNSVSDSLTSFYYGQDVSCDYETGAANAGSLDSPVLDLSGGSATTATLSFNYFLATFTPLEGNCLPMETVDFSADVPLSGEPTPIFETFSGGLG